MEFEDLEELQECDYKYWMKHDLLTIVQISFIACGNKPLSVYRIFFQHQDYYPKQNKIYSLLLSGLEANKIKATNQDDVSAKAPPLEWLTYLKNKDCSLPFYLNDVPSMCSYQVRLKIKMYLLNALKILIRIKK